MSIAVEIIYVLGILLVEILSLFGLYYLTRMSFDKSCECGVLNETEKNIAKLTIILQWLLIIWVVIGAIIWKLKSK